MFIIKESGRGWYQMEQMFKTLDKRLAYVRDQLTRDIAEEALRRMVARLPTKTDPVIEMYAKSLTIKEVLVPDKSRMTVIVITAEAPTEELRKLGGGRTVLEFQPQNLDRVSKLGRFLMEHGPWTMDTLPADPPKDMRKIAQVVSKNEVQEIARRNRETIAKHKPELQKAGVTVVKPSEDTVSTGVAEVDMASIAMRLEFGLGGFPEARHWSPTIEWMKKNVPTMFRKNKRYAKLLNDPNDQGWRRRPKKYPKMAMTKVVRYARFAQKIRGK